MIFEKFYYKVFVDREHQVDPELKVCLFQVYVYCNNENGNADYVQNNYNPTEDHNTAENTNGTLLQH